MKKLSVKARKVLSKLALAGSIFVLVVAVSVTSTILFQKLYFVPFWVNGQSMYPTLNKDAKYANGELIGRRREGEVLGNYDVDYGFMDAHKARINRIKRFDIIIFRAREDVVSYNIKRVIGLPGETMYITVDTINSENNGNLYIKDSKTGLFTEITQPIDQQFVHEGYYKADQSTEFTLADDEYFVMGDNRYIGNSLDSRTTGAIHKDLILGVAIGINATCRLIEKDGSIVPTDIKHYLPRFF